MVASALCPREALRRSTSALTRVRCGAVACNTPIIQRLWSGCHASAKHSLRGITDVPRSLCIATSPARAEAPHHPNMDAIRYLHTYGSRATLPPMPRLRITAASYASEMLLPPLRLGLMAWSIAANISPRLARISLRCA